MTRVKHHKQLNVLEDEESMNMRKRSRRLSKSLKKHKKLTQKLFTCSNQAHFQARWIEVKNIVVWVAWVKHGKVESILSGYRKGDKINESFYQALLEVMEWFDDRKVKEAVITTNHKFIVNQCNGNWKSDLLIDYTTKFRDQINKFNKIYLGLGTLNLDYAFIEKICGIKQPKPSNPIKRVSKRERKLEKLISSQKADARKDKLRSVLRFEPSPTRF